MNNSIIDYLDSQKKASDFSTRKKLAEENGISNYVGSASQNLSLLNTLRSNSNSSSRMANANTGGGNSGVVGEGANDLFTDGDGGASGQFSGLTNEEAQELDDARSYARQFGIAETDAPDFYSDPNFKIREEPKLSAYESKALGREYGYGGTNEYAGLTRGQAEAKAKEKGVLIDRQQSQRTSYAFNPETTSGAKKILDNFSFKLNSANNDPFSGKGSKLDFTKTLLESTANDFAKLFSDQESFNTELSNNPDFKNTIDNFTKSGGNIESITSRIKAPEMIQDVGEQDVATYLKNLSPNATPAQKEAFETLIPEKELAQQQIMSLAKIPKELQDLYFGTPEKIGLLEEKRIQAEEYKKILDKKAKDAEDDARTQANLIIEQNNADLAIESSKIEENRLKAKNYMTGYLAKMGALNTTGTAVQTLGILDQKYEQQAQQLRTKVQFKNREIQSKLTEVVHDLENTKEEEIYSLQSDLTKDKETVIKEIYKVQQSSAKEIFGVMSKYTTALRVQTDKYTAQAEKDAKEYAKAYAKTAGKYNPSSVAGAINTTKGKNAFKSSWTSQLESSRGADSWVDPAVYMKAYNDWVAKGGSIKDFMTNFPPKSFINPANDTILQPFRTTPKSTTKGREF